MSPQYGEFGPLTADIGSGVWDTPANFNGFCVLTSLLQRRRSPEANKTLCTIFGRLLGLYNIYIYIHFRGLLFPNGILPGAKFTLRPSLAFSYIGSVTVRHSSSGRQPNFCSVVEGMALRNFRRGTTYIWQGGHHVEHRPAFLIMESTSLQYVYHRKWANYI